MELRQVGAAQSSKVMYVCVTFKSFWFDSTFLICRTSYFPVENITLPFVSKVWPRRRSRRPLPVAWCISAATPASFLLPSVARPGAQDIPKQMLISRPFLSRQAATSSAPPLLLSSRPRTAGDLGGIEQRGRLQAEHEPATVPSLPAIAAASKGQVARPLSSERSGGAGGLSTITEATEPISFIEESLGTTASSLSEDLNTTRFGQDSQAVLWIRFQIGSVFTIQDPNLMYFDPQY